jgi:hypothetical protein
MSAENLCIGMLVLFALMWWEAVVYMADTIQ